VSDESTFIAMKVSALAVHPVTGAPVVILTDELSGVPVPVCIGLGEASAIAAELDRIDLERPLAHQLMAELLAAASARVVRVDLNVPAGVSRGRAGEPGRCVATVHLELADGRTVRRDARCSDALALALRCAAPVWVDTRVIERTGRDAGARLCPGQTPDDDAGDAALAEAFFAQLGEAAFGKWKM
jgi:uncharacterized protein